MRMVDLILKKKEGIRLSKDEIHYIIDGYVKGEIPDYQMSALLMAICFKGLDNNEVSILTKEMMNSGEIIDLSSIQGIKADKHSSGGVGDKTSLVLLPMVAACGVKVAKMSGRGLGHTGGTLDKLESIPHLNIYKNKDEFIKQVNDINIAIIGQSKDLVPADKKMYALRDVSGTVESIPLIASSIMSKKLASGSDTILLDVKYGHGAFMENKEKAHTLALTMINIGKAFNKDVKAIISNMNQPLGNAIGNSLEVIEAIQTLNGNGPEDLLELCLIAGSVILMQSKIADNEKTARKMLLEVINNKKALNKLKEMVVYQNGDGSYIDDISKFKKAKDVIEIKSNKAGYIKDIYADELGIVSMKLGGGRKNLEDCIDHSVGLVLNKKISDYVNIGDILLYVHTNNGLDEDIKNDILNAYNIVDDKVEKPVLIEEIL